MKQKSKQERHRERKAAQTSSTKPHTSKYARKVRAQSAYFAAGGTWAGWCEGRRNGTLRID